MASVVAGRLFNAIAYAGAGYVFHKLDKSGYEKEMKRHNEAMEKLSKEKEKWYKKNMADYIAIQYFVFLQIDLATFTTNEGWSFLISGIWQTIRSSKHLRHPERREIRRKRLPQDS